MELAIIFTIAYVIGGLTALVLISLTLASRSDAREEENALAGYNSHMRS